MSGRSRSRRRWVLIVDLIAIGLVVGALFVLRVTTSTVVGSTLGEFGHEPCECADLEADIETVDWLGTGRGIRFETPGISQFSEEGLEVEAHRLMPYSEEDGDILIARLTAQPETVQVTELRGEELGWTAFRHGRVVINVAFAGRIVINGPEEIDAMRAEIQELRETMGQVPRPPPVFRERLESAGLLYWAFGMSVLALAGVFAWLVGRIIRRQETRQPAFLPIDEDR